MNQNGNQNNIQLTHRNTGKRKQTEKLKTNQNQKIK